MRKYLFTLLFVALISTLWGQGIPAPMTPPRLVNDFAGLFSANQQTALETKLRKLNDETSTQIVVVTVKDLAGYDASQFATQLAHSWGVGDANKDNGIVVLIKPKTDSPGEIFIAVGYGLEGVVPDITAKQIVSREFIPEFQRGDLYAGADKGTDALIALVAGEYTADQYNKKNEGSIPIGWIGIIIFIIIAIAISRASRHDSGNHSGGTMGGGVPPIFFGGGGFGGGASGGFGGGSFGGFGGGGFGGGGAGGRW